MIDAKVKKSQKRLFASVCWFIVYILIICQISNICAHRIEFRDEENPLVEGSVCKFNHNNSLGTCTHSPLCPVASYEYQILRIRPSTCSFGTKYPSVCCFGHTNNLPTFPKLPFQYEFGNDMQPKYKETPQLPSYYDNHPKHIEKQKLRKSAYWCETAYGREPTPLDYLYDLSGPGGNYTEPGEFPHMVAIGWRDDWKTEWKCGGSLISENFVLSAAHCTTSNRIKPNVVRIGEESLLYDNEHSTCEIHLVFIHPEYHPPDYYNDIALIKLRDNVVFGPKIFPACLWQSNTHAPGDIIATGYGSTSYDKPSDLHLLKASLDIFPNNECSRSFGRDASLSLGVQEQTQICAGDREGIRGTCQGDSGGPLQCMEFGEKKRYYIIGMTSFGRACATKNPAIYTRVSAYLDWIEHIVWE